MTELLRFARRKPGFDTTIEYICTCGFVGGEHGELIARRGERFKGTSPVVAAAPNYFVRADTPAKDIPHELSFMRETRHDCEAV